MLPRLKYFQLVIVPFICLTFCFCLAADSKKDDSTVWGTETKGCCLGTSKDAVSADAGDAISIVVSIQNNGHDPVYYGECPGEPLVCFKISAVDADGKDVPNTRYARVEDGLGFNYTGKLDPGEKMSQTLLITRILDFSIAGEYSLKIQYRITAGGSVTLSSKTVKVTIKEVHEDGMKKVQKE